MFYFSAFYFLGRKRHPHFRFLFFVGAKMAVKKQKKSVLWLKKCTEGQNSWVTCSRIQPLSTSIATHRAWVLWGSKHWADWHWADSVCSLCCCSRLVSIASPARIFLSAPPTSAASEQLISAAEQTYSDRRSSLLGENADKLLFLAYNIRLFDFKYWSLHAERLTQWAI